MISQILSEEEMHVQSVIANEKIGCVVSMLALRDVFKLRGEAELEKDTMVFLFCNFDIWTHASLSLQLTLARYIQQDITQNTRQYTLSYQIAVKWVLDTIDSYYTQQVDTSCLHPKLTP